MTSSAAPGAVDAVLAILRAAPPLRDVRIWDGPILSGSDPAQLAVGAVAFEEEGGPAAVTSEFTGAGLGRRVERVDIGCRAVAWSGDPEMKPVRDRVYGILGAVADALAADPALGGAVIRARLGPSVSLAQTQTTDGPEAVLDFTVSCEIA